MTMRQQLNQTGAQAPPALPAALAPGATQHRFATKAASKHPSPTSEPHTAASVALQRPFEGRAPARPEENPPSVSDPLRRRLLSLIREHPRGKDLTLNPTRGTTWSATCRPCRRDWCPRPARRATRDPEGRRS